MKELIKGILREYDSGDSDGSYNDGSGVLFVDEAYQLTGPYVDGVGCQVLDIILTEMEENIGGDHRHLCWLQGRDGVFSSNTTRD